jgi:hypothetical protein
MSLKSNKASKPSKKALKVVEGKMYILSDFSIKKTHKQQKQLLHK